MDPPADDEKASVYAEGVREGILVGIAQGVEVGKSEIVSELKSLSN